MNVSRTCAVTFLQAEKANLDLAKILKFKLPRRDLLFSSLIAKGLIDTTDKSSLYYLLEKDFDPLNLGKRVRARSVWQRCLCFSRRDCNESFHFTYRNCAHLSQLQTHACSVHGCVVVFQVTCD